MGFVLNSIIQIGNYKFRGVHNVKIVKSIYSFTDTCEITIPATAVLSSSVAHATDSMVEVKNTFKEGDAVTVQLGYNGRYNEEFTGFVRRINVATPCIIECEGYVYQLRTPLQPKSYANTTLIDILKYITAGTNIVLAADIPDVPVTNFIIKGITGAQVLEKISKDLHLTIFFHGKELFAGLAYTQYAGTVQHQVGWNTIRDNELKKRIGANVQLQVNVIGVKTDGTKNIGKSGDNTTNIQKHVTHFVNDPAVLKAIADAILQPQKYDGYEGKLTTFGEPFCQHGWKTQLDDKRYQERSGGYLIDSIEVRYGMQGFRRMIGIGIKVS